MRPVIKHYRSIKAVHADADGILLCLFEPVEAGESREACNYFGRHGGPHGRSSNYVIDSPNVRQIRLG